MYSFFIDGMELPIAPQKLTVKIKGNNKTLTLINEGDINFLRAPGLTEITFDAVLPMLGQYSFANGYRRPDSYLNKLESLMTDKEPFRFLVSRVAPSGRLLYDTNMKVSLENYTVTEDATKGPDVTVSITLKQYISYSTKTVTVVKPKPEKSPLFSRRKSERPPARRKSRPTRLSPATAFGISLRSITATARSTQKSITRIRERSRIRTLFIRGRC